MKKLTALLLVLCCLNAKSQQSLVDSLGNSRFTMDDSIGRALAEYATLSVDLKVIDKQIEASKWEWKTNKASLLNNIAANFNLNERNIKGKDSLNNIFYPRYNFSLTLPVGNFITKPAQSRKTRAQYEETVLRKEAAIRDLKQAILVAYQDYSMNRYLLGIQEVIIQDESESFDQVQQKFKNNTITIETFTAATRRLNETLIQRVTLLRNLNVAKYNLEALIGTRLEDAMAAIRRKKR